MHIYLDNIGIIQDSTVEIKGLTVITGENNSGKTTVGKAVYSLVDGVSDLQQRSIIDKYNYAIKKLEDAKNTFPYYLVMSLKRGAANIQNECLRIFFRQDYRESIQLMKIEEYLVDLLHELDKLDIEEEPYCNIIDKRMMVWGMQSEKAFENFEERKRDVISIVADTLHCIINDPELINYTKQSINATLSTEFYGQIQPAALDNIISKIDMYDEGQKYFDVSIENNELCDTEDIVFWNTPYKRVFFIDNPFVLDEPIYFKATKYTTTHHSFVDEGSIVTHGNKLKRVLQFSPEKSVFEEGILNERYKKIKEKLDDILPGKFNVEDGERYYVRNGVKLKASNLATGTKVFSILKILLEKGLIDEDTLLILDEPESHMHPMWQNVFVEIIALLIKELGCHVLLTTHSSQFVLAIDAYMRKYEITDMCNFYQTKHIDDGMFVKYKCVNDSMNLIYNDFVSHLSDVKILRDMLIHSKMKD